MVGVCYDERVQSDFHYLSARSARSASVAKRSGWRDPGLEEAAVVLVDGRELQLVVRRPHARRDEPAGDFGKSQKV